MKALINVLKYVVMLAVGVFLFWLAFRGMEFKKIWAEIYNINYLYILLAFFVSALSHWIRAVRWNLLIRPMGYELSSFNSFIAVTIGYFANLALPRMGEVSRCVVLNRTNRIPADKLIGTVVVERVIDVVSLLIITFGTLIFEFKHISSFFSKNFGKKLAGNPVIERLTSTTGIVIAISFILIMIVAALFIYRKYNEAAFIVKLRKLLQGFAEGLRSVALMKKRWLFIFQTFLLWLFYYLAIYISFKALSFTDDLGLMAALSVLIAGSFGFVVPVQGGIGAYHAAVSQILLLYGLTLEQGLTFAFVAHTFQTIVILILGGFSFIYLTLNYRKAKVLVNPAPDHAETV